MKAGLPLQAIGAVLGVLGLVGSLWLAVAAYKEECAGQLLGANNSLEAAWSIWAPMFLGGLILFALGHAFNSLQRSYQKAMPPECRNKSDNA